MDCRSLRVSVTVTLSCSTMEIDIRSACRACLSTGKESFYSFTSYPEVRQLFVECTAIQIPILDPLPQQICSTCFDKCTIWRSFRRMALLVNQRLAEDLIVEVPESSESGTDDSSNQSNEAEPQTIQEYRQLIQSPPVVLVQRLPASDTPKLVNKPETYNQWNKCPICSVKVLDLGSNFRNHIKSHVSQEDPKCPICKKKFTSSSAVCCHIKRFHCEGSKEYNPNRTFSSTRHSSSSESYSDDSDVEFNDIHDSVKSPNDKLWVCKLCQKQFCKRSSLLRHHQSKTHRELKNHMKPFECPCCELKFAEPRNVTNHIKRAHQTISPISGVIRITGNFQCPLCSEHDSENFESFKNHLFSSHVPSDEEEKITCDICAISFAMGKDLLDHLFATHMGCTLQCNNCEFQDTSSSRMMIHLNRDHDIEMMMCGVCGKWTRSLELHMKTHTAKECSVCGKTFNSASGLKNHFLIHLPHNCPFCKGNFPSNTKLSEHLQQTHFSLYSNDEEVQVD